ncbi:MAG: hypothetical protein ACYTHK_05475 [Planctomycetota bacterium]|jgi:hypothetical protein
MRLAIPFFLVAAVAFAQDKADALKLRIAELDAAITLADKEAKTALGAARLEKLRAEREALLDRLRKLQSPEKQTEKIKPPDISKLVANAKKGDVPARNALLELRSQIDDALKPAPPNQPQQVFFGNGPVIIRRGQVVGLGGVQQVPPQPAAPKPAQKPAPIPVEEKKRLAEIDIKDQETRAAQLEQTIVELTRKALELERRVADLQAQIAAAEKR